MAGARRSRRDGRGCVALASTTENIEMRGAAQRWLGVFRRGKEELAVPITQYWHTETIPTEVLQLIETFRAHNPNCRHILFNETTAEDFIAAHFSQREIAAFRACAVPAMQADYLRYCALLVHGGVYADADMICLRSLGPLIAQVENAEFFRKRNGNVPNGFFIVRSPGHELLRFALEVATQNIEERFINHVWTATGPGIVTVLYHLSQGNLVDLQDRLSTSPGGNRDLARLIEVVRIEAGGRIHTILDGVRVSPISKLHTYAVARETEYKESPTHWLNWPGSIYR